MRRRKRRRHGRPVPVGEVVDDVLEDAGLRRGVAEHRAWVVWEQVCGGPIAANARPAYVEDGVLTVHVQNATWMTELAYLKDAIRDRLNEAVGMSVFRELRLRVGRLGGLVPPRPVPEHLRLRPPRTRPATALEERVATSAVAGVPEGPLRDALRRIYLRQAASDVVEPTK